ncbi:hypothetical protein FRC02_000289 [Tulasnella sp. 418]|nr:hypothetical protein FRC02_000289 [Tulasnella sp. 418]
MGTFHAICVRYLRRHGKKIGLENNFSICDADESKKIVLKIILTHIEAKEIIDIKDSVIRSMISTAKSKAQTPAQLRQESKRPGGDQQKLVVAEIYEEYEEALRQNNSLDFDDLLVYGVRLFDKAPAVLKDIEHILVDEFQDTSVLQYVLVKQFAKASGCVTIVGDPDQSIYGWRAAEIENLGKMMKDFPTTAQIFLEENYRSTASILAVSHAIVSQDKQRIAKSLYTSHASGSTPVLRLTANEHAEADFISGEIKRLMAYSGGMLDYNDFAILLRYNALSRPIEASFQREGIPVRMLAGQKFFERAEIKDILAYLQLVDNPSFNPAFHRVVNVPARAIGDKSVQDLENLAKTKGWSSLYAAERICQGKIAASDCKSVTRLKKQLPAFVAVIRKLKDLAQKGTSVPDLIMRLVELIKYEEHLQKIYPQWESRWENVQELIKFAHEISSSTPEPSASQPTPTIKPASQLVLTDDGDFVEVKEESADSKEVANEVTDDTPLRKFLQVSSLSTDTEASEQEADANGPKVTVSTCHAAKGLEWPVVFIPSVEQGTYPYYRTEDVQEERRLLYVGCTRAQFLLYLTHAKIRLEMGAPCKKKNLSQLITPVLKTNMSLFSSQKLPSMDTIERKILGQLLGRPVSSNHQVTEAVSQHRPSHRIQEAYHVWSHVDKPTFRSSDRRWNEDNRKPCSADGEGEGPSRARPEWTYPAFSGAAKPATGTILSND